MKNMSFQLTTPQIRNRTKTVTRRLGWANLKPGEEIQAVEKGQGIPKGEKIKKLCVIRIVDVRQEPLDLIEVDRHYGFSEVVLEGFPKMHPEDFVKMFIKHNGCDCDDLITRIEFEYVNTDSSQCGEGVK